MVRSQTDEVYFLRTRRIVEQGILHLSITSSGYHFFNKTDLEQYV